MTTDLTERGLERRICTALTGLPCEPDAAASAGGVCQRPAACGAGWTCGDADDYDREYCVDLRQLAAFLAGTQPRLHDAFALDEDGPTRRKFLARLQGETARRGTVDVLRKGPRTRTASRRSVLRHAVRRQRKGGGALRREPLFGHPAASLRPGRDGSGSALDLALFVNGLPGRDLRAQEQPHQADGGRCGPPVPPRPRPARAALRAGPVRGALRGGRARGEVLYAPAGQLQSCSGHFADDEGFKRWLTDAVFDLTCEEPATAAR